MANEFVARKGLIVSGSTTISGSASINGSVTASYFKGDGSQLTNLPSANSTVDVDTYYFTGSGVQTNFNLNANYNINSLFVTVGGLSSMHPRTTRFLVVLLFSFLHHPQNPSSLLRLS